MDSSARQSRDPTSLLTINGMVSGGQDAGAYAFDLMYKEMRRLARYYMKGERPDHTLQPTALVHEAYMRLAHRRKAKWHDRAHFLRAAAREMRRILVEHARSRLRVKRGAGAQKVPLDDVSLLSSGFSEELLALDQCLNGLSKMDPRLAEVVELRFFAGLTVEETAKVLGVSTKTIKRDWNLARTWLYGELRVRNGLDS